jgi:hypothetical protein
MTLENWGFIYDEVAIFFSFLSRDVQACTSLQKQDIQVRGDIISELLQNDISHCKSKELKH